MPLIDRINDHATHLANLTYGPDGDSYRFTVVPTQPPLTESKGVYFLLSHNNTQIQKVGLANGYGGLRQRMQGYVRLYRPQPIQQVDGGDPTMALWFRVMTGPLQGQPLSLWFLSMSESRTTEVLGKKYTLWWDPHPDLERFLSQEACDEGHPLLLSTQRPQPIHPMAHFPAGGSQQLRAAIRKPLLEGTNQQPPAQGYGGQEPPTPPTAPPEFPDLPFERGSIAQYFYKQFPSDLALIDVKKANELLAPEPAVFFGGESWENVTRDLTRVSECNREKCVLSLFMVTITEQVIYTYHRASYPAWRSRTGFPKFGWSGYGFHHGNPFILLQRPVDAEVVTAEQLCGLMPEFTRFYLQATEDYLRRHLPQIEMGLFLRGLMGDQAYANASGPVALEFKRCLAAEVQHQ